MRLGVHWFRRDLRIQDNVAFNENCRQTQGNTLGVFCLDTQFLSRDDFSANRFAFFLKTLLELQKDLRNQGGDLWIVAAPPTVVLSCLMQVFGSTATTTTNSNSSTSNSSSMLLTWNRDYEPYARARDKTIYELAQQNSIEVKTYRDHLILEPQEVLKSDGGFYQVFTPFARKWLEVIQQKNYKDRVVAITSPNGSTQASPLNKISFQKQLALHTLRKYLQTSVIHESGVSKVGTNSQYLNVLKKLECFLESQTDDGSEFQRQNDLKVTIKIPDAGTIVAQEKFKKFQKLWVQSSEARKFGVNYTNERDFPFLNGTSQLSIYLKNGSLTTQQIVRGLYQACTGASHLKSTEKSFFSLENIFLKELIWREFYYSILLHCPRVEQESFLSQYKSINWENDIDLFEKWKSGQTGFPIVDAGMRQLRQTGWMHNRVRMIVASFLTKDLLIDYRWGEKYFMHQLLDGDLAANNGGWQWAASTGCDAQPYFRIFNPWLQGAKFDPQAQYIKTYIPELKNISAKEIHDPNGERNFPRYPNPIVDHALQKQKAILLYKK